MIRIVEKGSLEDKYTSFRENFLVDSAFLKN